MDLELVQFLFSIGFVILGSIVFHISTLISGYSIYQEKNAVESSFLSLAAGIVIFLYSPIVFIVLSVECENLSVFLDNILNLEVIISFLSCAIGLGLIFGYFTTLDARKLILIWFREKTGIKFWIQSYSISWDDILRSAKKGGEISVKTKDLGELQGKVDIYSIRNEPNQIVLNQPDGKILILGDEIQSIKVPERSFKKHYETMNHVAQAFNCVMIAVGVFLLAYSASTTCDYYSQKSEGLNESFLWNCCSISLAEHKSELSSHYNKYQISDAVKSCPNSTDTDIEAFYIWSKCIFLILSIIFLAFSILLAEKDFQNWRSYLKICPEFLCIFCMLSITFVCLLFWNGVYFKTSDENSVMLLYLNALSIKMIMLILFGTILLGMLFWTTQRAEHIQIIATEFAKTYTNKNFIKQFIYYTKGVRSLTMLLAILSVILITVFVEYLNAFNMFLVFILLISIIFIIFLLLILEYIVKIVGRSGIGSRQDIIKYFIYYTIINMSVVVVSLLIIIIMLVVLSIVPTTPFEISYNVFAISLYFNLPRINAIFCILWIVTSLIIINSIIKLRHRKTVGKIIDDIENDPELNKSIALYYPDYSEQEVKKRIYKYLYKIRQNMYINLCLNVENKSHINELSSEAIATYNINYERIIAREIALKLIERVNKFKEDFPHMRDEDVNILLVLDRVLKERINEPKMD